MVLTQLIFVSSNLPPNRHENLYLSFSYFDILIPVAVASLTIEKNSEILQKITRKKFREET